jgi:hypothetical protein
MFCLHGIVFGGTDGVKPCFHVLRAQTHFRRYRGRRVPFLSFARPDSFSAVPWASGPLFMFCESGIVFGGTEGVGSIFDVLRAQTYFRRNRGRRVPFSCCVPGFVFDGTEGVGSRFHVLRAQTRFCRYRGRRVPFSCFARPDSFSAVPRALGPVFMFHGHRIVFGDTEGVGSRFHVLRARTSFRLFRGRRVMFSYFALPVSFSTVSSASVMFCAPRLIFDGTEGVLSRFHVLRALTHFRRFRGRRVPFSCFSGPDSFSAVPTASGPVFLFCAPRTTSCSTKGVDSTFNALRSRTRFQRDRGLRVPISSFACTD